MLTNILMNLNVNYLRYFVAFKTFNLLRLGFKSMERKIKNCTLLTNGSMVKE